MDHIEYDTLKAEVFLLVNVNEMLSKYPGTGMKHT